MQPEKFRIGFPDGDSYEFDGVPHFHPEIGEMTIQPVGAPVHHHESTASLRKRMAATKDTRARNRIYAWLLHRRHRGRSN